MTAPTTEQPTEQPTEQLRLLALTGAQLDQVLHALKSAVELSTEDDERLADAHESEHDDDLMDLDEAREYTGGLQATYDLIKGLAEGDAPCVQIIHSRDPDYECGWDVFVDGVRYERVDWADFDPGRGYEASDFAERLEDARADVEGPDATEYDRAYLQRLEQLAPAFRKWGTGDWENKA